MNASKLPPLIMIRAFEAVGRTGSIRKAAEDIGVSHNVVGYHIRNLESWLGTVLIERSPRGVTLTPEGRQFHATVAEALARIAAAAGRLRSPRRVLNVFCPYGLASRWLTPRLSHLEQHLPGCEISVHPCVTLPEKGAGPGDLLIGYGPQDDVPPGAEVITWMRAFPIASPGFVRLHGQPSSVADMLGFPLIHEQDLDQWAGWFAAAGVTIGPAALKGPRLGNLSLCIDATVAGQGIALGFSLVVRDLLAGGQLVELLATDIHLGCYYLLSPAEVARDPVRSRFVAWLKEQLAQTA
ncbi:LysR substrate-binding domain-containing protein [Paenirhodobacter sp.]|uniref:LysR substrate-binding domain-containing protein n=1 Tax=Paenirhodobacter sp. TaxID=1965326 RepID=UPI003B422C28